MRTSNEREKVVKAINKFNKYRAPEAVAKLLSLNKKSFKIQFSGPFCRSCGFYDYFDDMKISLEEVGLKARIEKIKELQEGGIVEFGIIVKQD